MFSRLLNRPYVILGFFAALFISSSFIYAFLMVQNKTKEIAGYNNMVKQISELNKLSLEKRELIDSLLTRNIYDPMVEKHLRALQEFGTPVYEEDRVLEQIYKMYQIKEFNSRLFINILPLSEDEDVFATIIEISDLDRKISEQQAEVEKAILY